MARRSGRAPNSRLVPFSIRNSLASSVSTSFRPFSFSRLVTFASSMSMICFRSSLVRLRKTMMSSTRLRNSGRKFFSISSFSMSFIFS